MDNTEARDWAKDFENKSVSELRAMLAPEGLSHDAGDAWWIARACAIDAREDAEEGAAADKPLPASREDRTRLLLDEMHDAELRAKARENAAQVPLTLPEGDAALLLEKQIASSAALIGYLSNYVARADTDPSVCMSFMDRMTAMLGASANVGKVVGRLRGQVSRTEQNINVNHLEGERVVGNVTSNGLSDVAPQDVDAPPRRKRGARCGNRNRFKTGLYTNEAKALRKQIAQWKRETRTLLQRVEAATSPPPRGEADKIRSAAKNFSGGGKGGKYTPPTRNLRSANFDLPTRGGDAITNNPS